MEQFTDWFVKVFNVSAARYFVLAGIPFLLFYYFMPRQFQQKKIQQRNAVRRDFLREIAYSLGSTLVFTVIAVLVLYTPLRQYSLVYDQLSDFPGWYIVVSLLAALAIHDTYFYWTHRLLHHPRIFRHVHLVHHKSTNPSPWASYSFHFLEAIVEGLIIVVITFALPLHPVTIILFTVTGFIINVYGHLGYEIMPRWLRQTILFQIINTSVHHNLHHRQFNGNYGLYFRFWDRLMGTEHPGYVREYDRIDNQRFGNG
jgi:lathosterol oxidase